jgi:hypothetical protein
MLQLSKASFEKARFFKQFLGAGFGILVLRRVLRASHFAIYGKAAIIDDRPVSI